MNKILFGLLTASVAMNFYLVNVEVVVKDDLDQEVAPEVIEQSTDTISIAQAAVAKASANSECPNQK